MIQRIQSLYLLISSILMLGVLYLPLASADLFKVTAFGVVSTGGELMQDASTYYFALPLVITLLITAASIFLFQNRKRQMAVIRLTFIFFAFTFLLLGLCIKDVQNLLKQGDEFSFDFAFYLPFVSFILNFLALQAVRKDERLVRSIDRIR